MDAEGPSAFHPSKATAKTIKDRILTHLFLINIYQNPFKFYQIANISNRTADFLG